VCDNDQKYFVVLFVVWAVMGKHGQLAALHFVQSHQDYADRAQWRLRRSVVQQLIVCVLRGVVLWVCSGELLTVLSVMRQFHVFVFLVTISDDGWGAFWAVGSASSCLI
jgi:hypothetical protein